MNLSEKRIAIIGGGISGLSAAQRLCREMTEPGALAEPGATPASGAAPFRLTLMEASPRLGGIIQSSKQDGFLFEHSADSFIVTDELPWAGRLCEQVGIELTETSSENRGALILRDGQFYPIPAGLQLMTVRDLSSVLRSPLLGWRGKLRVAMERFVPRVSHSREESLQQFATRRFGKEMFERIVQPLVGGIYTADPAKLSVAAALPQYTAMERRYGTLARAAAASKSPKDDRGARYGLFRTPIHGMQSLIDAVKENISGTDIRTNTKVSSVERGDGHWIVSTDDQQRHEFDGVLCSTPITRLGGIVSQASTQLSQTTEEIKCVSTAIVCMGFRRSQIAHPLNAFGCVIPAIENRKILAISFTNRKFPTRAPEGHMLLRVFVGGALQSELAELDDDALMKTVTDEIQPLLGVEGPPVTSRIVRWPKTTPQYHLGHLERVAAIERHVSELPNFEIAGNAFRGVGVPQCVRSGWDAADRLITSLRGNTVDSK